MNNLKQKYIINTKITIFSVFCFAFLLPINVYAETFSISPAQIIIKDISPGTTYTENLTLQRSGENINKTPVNYTLEKKSDWLEINRGSNIIFPGEETKIEIPLILELPKDLNEGYYQNTIYLTLEKNDINLSAVDKKLGHSIKLELFVKKNTNTEEKIIIKNINQISSSPAFKIGVLKIPGFVEFKAKIKNPTPKEIKIEKINLSSLGGNILMTEEKNHLLEPFQEKNIHFKVYGQLNSGDHLIYVNFYSAEKFSPLFKTQQKITIEAQKININKALSILLEKNLKKISSIFLFLALLVILIPLKKHYHR